MNDLVSVVIVSCAARDYFISCLESVAKQSYHNIEVVLIDNSLNSDLAQQVNSRFPAVIIYSSPRNLFYSESLNKGIQISRGDFVLCLNDDVILEENFIEEALKPFGLADRIGMVSGKLLRRDAKTIDSTGLFLSAWRTAKERGYGKPDYGQYDKGGFVFGVSGAAAFYRRDMLDDVMDKKGYFDPDFHMFYEDLDIAWRANRHKWKAYYAPSAVATHVRGGSFRPESGLNKGFARRYLDDDLHCGLIRNRYRTIFKNETFFGFAVHLIPIMLYDLLAWSYVLLFRPKVAKRFVSSAFAGPIPAR